ncbi:MAG TPA: MFS transporter [Candidatus Saccharimonadales bacterium]|nr:MFS transporter [Candidatus Saccharimonadales bacterium]
MSTNQVDAGHSSAFSAAQKKIALLIVAFAFVMDLLDSTIVNIAIPSIQSNLGASYATIQWLIAGYSLTFALLLITGGRMGDVFGYKKIFMFGVAGFSVASLLAGISPSPEFLVGARLLQGSMAALMVPQVMSLMQVMYNAKERAGVMGMFGMLGGLAASLGPIIGGLLIKANIFNLDWRPIFLINLPVGIFALLAGIKYLPNNKSEHPLHIDIKGTVLIVVALSLLVFPLIEGRDLDWPVWTIVTLAAAIPALAIFGWYEIRKDKRDHSALIVPALFRIRTFATGLLLNIIVQASMVGYFLTITLVMQVGLGYSPLKAALTGVPTAVGMTLGFTVLAQKLLIKFGRSVIGIGAIIFTSGLAYAAWALTHWGVRMSPWEFTPGLLLLGIGLSLIMVPIFSVALQDVDPSHAGSASGILSAIQQVGAAVGIAVIGVIFFGQLDRGAVQSFSVATPKLHSQLTALHVPAQAQDAIIAQAQTCYHDRITEKDANVIPPSCQSDDTPGVASQKISAAITDGVKQANAQNFAVAFRWGVVYTILLLFVICGLSLLLPNKFRISEHGAA